MGINLDVIPLPVDKYPNPYDLLKKVADGMDDRYHLQTQGLISSGHINCTQVSGGYGWAISEKIEFSWVYLGRPIFTWGSEGTMSPNYTIDVGYAQELPAEITSKTSENSAFQPAIFVPRVVHWTKEDNRYYGCYMLVIQLNPNSTENDKVNRLHYRFEGKGLKRG